MDMEERVSQGPGCQCVSISMKNKGPQELPKLQSHMQNGIAVAAAISTVPGTLCFSDY